MYQKQNRAPLQEHASVSSRAGCRTRTEFDRRKKKPLLEWSPLSEEVSFDPLPTAAVFFLLCTFVGEAESPPRDGEEMRERELRESQQGPARVSPFLQSRGLVDRGDPQFVCDILQWAIPSGGSSVGTCVTTVLQIVPKNLSFTDTDKQKT